jgi:hypothetical protein
MLRQVEEHEVVSARKVLCSVGVLSCLNLQVMQRFLKLLRMAANLAFQHFSAHQDTHYCKVVYESLYHHHYHVSVSLYNSSYFIMPLFVYYFIIYVTVHKNVTDKESFWSGRKVARMKITNPVDMSPAWKVSNYSTTQEFPNIL